MRAPALERAPGGARPDARALPAVVRVRLARRLRGDALGRPGLDAATARSSRWCSGCGWRRRAARSTLPALPASAAGPGAAPAAGRLGGHAGRDHRAVAARAPGAARARSTRASSSRTSRPACEALRALAQRARAARRGAPLRRGRDAHVAGARGHGRREGQARARVPGRARLRRRAASRSSASRAAARTSRAGASARSQLARASGGLPVGRSPGEAWLQGRFAAPYLRDELLDARRDGRDARDGHAVVERRSACTRAVGEAIADALRARRHAGPRDVPRLAPVRDGRVAVLHVHRAPARGRGDRAVARASRRPPADAIVAGGGTITHHHAVGRDHAPWMAREVGEGGVRGAARGQGASSTRPGS